jgi:hypothetical protein
VAAEVIPFPSRQPAPTPAPDLRLVLLLNLKEQFGIEPTEHHDLLTQIAAELHWQGRAVQEYGAALGEDLLISFCRNVYELRDRLKAIDPPLPPTCAIMVVAVSLLLLANVTMATLGPLTRH